MDMLFLELFQFAFGNRVSLGKILSEDERRFVFNTAEKQAIAGIIFEALDPLSKTGQKIPTVLLFDWIGLAERIKNQNIVVNQRCRDITKHFSDAGFASDSIS